MLEPSQWLDALESLSKLLDARAAGIRIETVDVGVDQLWFGLNTSFNESYVDYYWQYDPWVEPGRLAAVGHVAHGDRLVPRRLVEVSPFHAELSLPNGFDDVVGAVLERSSARMVTLGAMKGAGRKRFGDDASQLMSRVLPHFQRALTLTNQLANQRVLGAPQSSVTETLRTDYHLTPAEIRVAFCIAAGLCPKEVAMHHGVSWNTVRAQLRTIYAKTETGSQRALASLITRMEVTASRSASLSNILA